MGSNRNEKELKNKNDEIFKVRISNHDMYKKATPVSGG